MSTIRENYEKFEHEFLSDRAAFSDNAVRSRDIEKCPLRTEYQRDRDRIIHSSSFRRLKHKTQVFLSPEGDHYRTRLTHTLEVAQIARTIARALRLNEDLTEAIALGHDLGHTPFGHAGERALDKICGGFCHYEQSVRVCKIIEHGGEGLNLTLDTLDGMLCHTKGREASTLEGRIVRIADRIAYVNHDIDDAVRAGVLSENDIPTEIRERFGHKKSERINSMVLSVIENSVETIKMSDADADIFEKLHAFLFQSVYTNPLAKSEENKVDGIIGGLYEKITENPSLLPASFDKIRDADGVSRATADYIAGMTDTYALDCYERLFLPKSWAVKSENF